MYNRTQNADANYTLCIIMSKYKHQRKKFSIIKNFFGFLLKFFMYLPIRYIERFLQCNYARS